MTRPLTASDRLQAFLRATRGFKMALDELSATAPVALTDGQLADLLGKRMSIYGSSGDRPAHH